MLNGRGIRRTEADLARCAWQRHRRHRPHRLPAKVLAAEIPGGAWTTVQMRPDPAHPRTEGSTVDGSGAHWMPGTRGENTSRRRRTISCAVAVDAELLPTGAAPSITTSRSWGTASTRTDDAAYGGPTRDSLPYGSWVSFEQTASLCPPKRLCSRIPLAAAPASTPAVPLRRRRLRLGSALRFESIQLLGQSSPAAHAPADQPRPIQQPRKANARRSWTWRAAALSTRNQVSCRLRAVATELVAVGARWSAPRGACWMRTRTRSTRSFAGSRARLDPGTVAPTPRGHPASPHYVAVTRPPPLRHPRHGHNPAIPPRIGIHSESRLRHPLPGASAPPRRRQPVPLGTYSPPDVARLAPGHRWPPAS